MATVTFPFPLFSFRRSFFLASLFAQTSELKNVFLLTAVVTYDNIFGSQRKTMEL